jgi:hypothetical protein
MVIKLYSIEQMLFGQNKWFVWQSVLNVMKLFLAYLSLCVYELICFVIVSHFYKAGTYLTRAILVPLITKYQTRLKFLSVKNTLAY